MGVVVGHPIRGPPQTPYINKYIKCYQRISTSNLESYSSPVDWGGDSVKNYFLTKSIRFEWRRGVTIKSADQHPRKSFSLFNSFVNFAIKTMSYRFFCVYFDNYYAVSATFLLLVASRRFRNVWMKFRVFQWRNFFFSLHLVHFT